MHIVKSNHTSGISTRLSSGRTMFTNDTASIALRKGAGSVCSKRKLHRCGCLSIDFTKQRSKELTLEKYTRRCVKEKDSTDLTNKTFRENKSCANTVAVGQIFDGGESFKYLKTSLPDPPLQESFRRVFENTLVEADSRFPKLDSSKRSNEDERKHASLPILLNLLAALYGSGIAAIEIADDASPAMSPSFISLLRSTSALLVHFPALISALRDVEPTLIRAGVELGSWSFLYSLIPTFSTNGSGLNDAPLLYALSVVLVLVMKVCVGQSITRVKWFSTVIALSGMGVLEEEGSGWKGITIPQISGNPWVLASSFVSALQIFRAEALGISEALDAKRLNAVQTAVLFLMSFFWEMYNVLCSSSSADAAGGLNFATLAQHLPWPPALIYNGLVCGGLCSWLEIRADLRGVHASNTTLIYTTIPVWGAFFSSLVRQKSAIDVALLGGSIILLATIWSSKMTTYLSHTNSNSQLYKSTDLGLHETPQIITSKSSPLNRRGQVRPEDDHDGNMMGNALISTILSADHLPGVMLITQLKSPFYAAQTERLVNDLDHLLIHTNTDGLSNFACYFKDPLQNIDINIGHAANIGDGGPPSFLGTEDHFCDIGA